MTKPICILLIDDHPVVRTGYRRLLESTPDIYVVAEADDGELFVLDFLRGRVLALQFAADRR